MQLTSNLVDAYVGVACAVIIGVSGFNNVRMNCTNLFLLVPR